MIDSAAQASALVMRPAQAQRIATSERTRTNVIDGLNRAWYRKASAKSARASAAPFEPTLTRILFKYRADIMDRRVLDVGLGPSQFERIDVRDLRAFASYSFHCVVDSSGALGALGHAPRLRALSEMARITPPHGLLVFAAHNRRCIRAVQRPRLEWSRNPLTQMLNVVRWIRRSVNRARLRALQYDGAEYALINDPTHEYALLHYHISRDTQARQLASNGFRLLEMYDSKGRSLVESSDDRASPWIWYVARRTDIRLVR